MGEIIRAVGLQRIFHLVVIDHDIANCAQGDGCGVGGGGKLDLGLIIGLVGIVRVGHSRRLVRAASAHDQHNDEHQNQNSDTQSNSLVTDAFTPQFGAAGTARFDHFFCTLALLIFHIHNFIPPKVRTLQSCPILYPIFCRETMKNSKFRKKKPKMHPFRRLGFVLY